MVLGEGLKELSLERIRGSKSKHSQQDLRHREGSGRAKPDNESAWLKKHHPLPFRSCSSRKVVEHTLHAHWLGSESTGALFSGMPAAARSGQKVSPSSALPAQLQPRGECP